MLSRLKGVIVEHSPVVFILFSGDPEYDSPKSMVILRADYGFCKLDWQMPRAENRGSYI